MCKSCEEKRFPSVTSVTVTVPDDVLNNPVSDVRNELLCFLLNKMNIMCFDDVVKVASDFHRDEEILGAKVILSGLLPEKRITNQHGEKKTQKSIEDILKLLLDP